MDPAGALRREPVDFVVDFGGEARVLTDFTAAAYAGPPIELETLEIREARLSALGAALSATGALDISGVAARPDGEIILALTDVMRLIDDLVAGGFLPPEIGEVYRALALEFTEQGDAPNERVSRIVSRNGVVTANGKLLAQ